MSPESRNSLPQGVDEIAESSNCMQNPTAQKHRKSLPVGSLKSFEFEEIRDHVSSYVLYMTWNANVEAFQVPVQILNLHNHCRCMLFDFVAGFP